MKRYSLFIFTVLALSAGSCSQSKQASPAIAAQDSTLRAIVSRSELIAGISILGSTVGWSDMDATEEIVYAKVQSCMKGNVQRGDTLVFTISHAVQDTTHGSTVVQKDASYIVFLSATENKAQYGSLQGRQDQQKWFTVYHLSDEQNSIRQADAVMENMIREITGTGK